MNKVILSLIVMTTCALPGVADSNAQIQQRMERQVESHCWNNQPICTYQSNHSPSIQYGANQPITRAQYPITIDQQYQSPYTYNP